MVARRISKLSAGDVLSVLFADGPDLGEVVLVGKPLSTSPLVVARFVRLGLIPGLAFVSVGKLCFRPRPDARLLFSEEDLVVAQLSQGMFLNEEMMLLDDAPRPILGLRRMLSRGWETLGEGMEVEWR